MENEWYKTRNKRTDALSGVNEMYKTIRVGVIAGTDMNRYNRQVMLLTTVNILSRWCSHITVLVPEIQNVVTANGKYAGSLPAAIKQIILANDPQADLAINDETREYDFCIYIGSPVVDSSVPYVSVGSNGWVASCGYNHHAVCEGGMLDTTNPLGAAYAACLANAETFRWSLGIKTDPYVKWYSLFTMETSELPLLNSTRFKHNLSLGRMHIIGCGAIGSSFAWLLSLTNWSGEITLADMDKEVDLHNTSSSLLFTDADATNKKTKVSICHDHLQGGNFKVREFCGEYGLYKYDYENPLQSADVLMCFANDKNIWETVQNLCPPVTFHATTSSSWGVNIGRHIPLIDECIYCTFKELIKSNYVPKCSVGEMPGAPAVNTEEEKPSAILPFLSPAAAVLTMAQLYKLYDGKIERENSLQMNFSTAEGDFLTDFFKPGNCPVCKDQLKEVYAASNQHTLFWPLSC